MSGPPDDLVVEVSGRVIRVHAAVPPSDPGEADWDALTPDEQAQARGMAAPSARATHVAGRALLRRALATELGLSPDAVPLRADSGMPPRLDGDLRTVSVSHTSGLVVVAIGPPGSPLGVDVERRDRWPLPPARTWLTGAEANRLASADRLASVVAWTAKEAVAKGLGTGLGTPLTAIEVTGGTARATGHALGVWHLHTLARWPDHLVTVAVAPAL